MTPGTGRPRALVAAMVNIVNVVDGNIGWGSVSF
jgi:hypothetical protein